MCCNVYNTVHDLIKITVNMHDSTFLFCTNYRLRKKALTIITSHQLAQKDDATEISFLFTQHKSHVKKNTFP